MRPLLATSKVSGVTSALLEHGFPPLYSSTSVPRYVISHARFLPRALTLSASRAECVQDIEAALRRDMEKNQTRRLADAPQLRQRQADKETPEAVLVQKRVGCTLPSSHACAAPHIFLLHTHQQQPSPYILAQMNELMPEYAKSVSAEEQKQRDVVISSFARRASNYLDHASKCVQLLR